jgi:hypothetical protein
MFSNYATLKENRNMNIAVNQTPSYIQFKDNPLSNDSIIASNVAGITYNPQPSIDKISEKFPEGDLKPYEYVYQSCCSLTLPKSPEYVKTREIIMAP